MNKRQQKLMWRLMAGLRVQQGYRSTRWVIIVPRTEICNGTEYLVEHKVHISLTVKDVSSLVRTGHLIKVSETMEGKWVYASLMTILPPSKL